jgi:hypothetical protein
MPAPTASLTTPDGTRYTLTVEHPPMQVGLTASAVDYISHAKTFPRAAFCRTFAGPGQGLPKLGGAPWPEWASYKDPVQPAALNAWLDRVTRPTILTYRHERDNDPGEANQSKAARADFFARWRDLYQIVCEHRNRPLVQAIPIQTLQWTEAKSGSSAIKGDGDWRTWTVGVGDGVGWDCYVGSWEPKYPDPERWLRIPIESAEGSGRRLWLPELGSVLLGGDTGAGRAAWIRDVLAVLRENNCAGAAWWCAIGKPGTKGEIRDFHLADQPSAAAWREAIEARE